MLQTINGRAKQWIILPLFGLLILSFVAWGIADVFQGRTGADTVITVGKVEYSGQQLQAEVQRGMEYLRQMTGGAITTKQAMQFGFVTRTTENMIQRALLQQEATRLGIVVSDDVIMKAIRDLPEFKKADGTFDSDAFKKALMRIGANEQLFIAEQRLSLARAQVQQVAAGGATAPDLLNKAIIAAAAETRDFDLFHIKSASQKIAATPDDAALKAFMEEHADVFSLPEYRALTLVRLSANDVSKDLSVKDDDVTAYYESHLSEFAVPEKRSYKQVVASTQEQAVKIIAAYGLTRDFAAAAKSVDATVTELNSVSKNELPPELRDAAYGLTNGTASQALKSDLGWHVLQQTAVEPASQKTFEQAKETIRTNLLQQAAQDRLYEASAQLDDLIAGGASLEDIAAQLNIELRKIELVDAKGDTPQGVAAGPILGQREMLAAAFKLEQGAQSDVITTPANDYFVVRVDNVTPSKLKDLASARNDVLKEWQKLQQQNMATELAIKVLGEAKKGTVMQMIASQFGVESSAESNLSRESDAWPKYIPGAFAKDLFALKIGDASQFPTEDGVLVARLTAVRHPVAVEDADVTSTFAQKSSDVMQGELFDAYSQSLRRRYKVEINQTAIDKLFAEEEAE